jgi:uncharacterized protein YjbI with pentapeptide repeats
MKFEIKHRWTGAVQFECKLAAEIAGMPYGVQLGFAVEKAVERGANLSGANLRGADLSGVDLSGVDLSDVDLRGANLRDANLSGVDLSGVDLSGVDLRGADLRGANLSDANLSGVDLRGADLSGSWIPRIENIHQAIYEAAVKPGALDMGTWHAGDYCGTTHCRAGWTVVLAGDGGRVLEGCYGTAAAAALIYQASDPTLERIPDFYASNDSALADMKRLAEAEANKTAAA